MGIIEFHTFHTKVFYAIYDKVDMRQLLPDLTAQWPSDLIQEYKGQPFEVEKPTSNSNQSNEIVHEYFWHALPNFIPENSIVVAETGTSEFGKFDRDDFTFLCNFIFQVFSICVHRKVLHF